MIKTVVQIVKPSPLSSAIILPIRSFLTPLIRGFNNAYQPDAYNRITRETTDIAGTSFSVTYGYDDMDRITGITCPHNPTVTYSYNTLGEITGMPGYVTGLPVYTQSLLTKVKAANGVESNYAYDVNGRLNTLEYKKGASGIKSHAFTYDGADNIARIMKKADGGAEQPNYYDYDEENRLKTAILNGKFTADVKDEMQSALTAPLTISNDLFGGAGLIPSPDDEVKLDCAAGRHAQNIEEEIQREEKYGE